MQFCNLWHEKKCESDSKAVLIMPLVMFLAPNDPRMLNTIRAIMRPPERGGLMVNDMCLRYLPLTEHFTDGLPGHEGTFSMCTFWQVPSLGFHISLCIITCFSFVNLPIPTYSRLIEALTRAGKYSPHLLEKAQIIFEEMLTYGNHLGL
jgi:hypothetical protein